MNKKNVFNDGKRQNFPYSTSEFKRIRPYERYEVDPILSQLFVKNMAEHPELADQLSETKRYNRYVNEILTMYIIIRNVSALEYYLRHAASKIVDSNKSIEFDFVNPLEINRVFSRLLGKKFFETIKKINSRAGKHPWKCCRSRGLVKNWHNFENMFEQRNEIVHLMKRIRLSKDELCSLCNNTRMFMEQANVLVYGAVQGGNAEQDFFHENITEQEKLHHEEQERTSKPSKKKKIGE